MGRRRKCVGAAGAQRQEPGRLWRRGCGAAGFCHCPHWVLSIEVGPLVSLAVATNVLAALTASASGGLTIALDALGQIYMAIAAQTALSPALMHRVAVIGSGTLDMLPHNGATVTLLAVCGTTHRESYFDIGMTGIANALLGLVAVIVLGRHSDPFERENDCPHDVPCWRSRRDGLEREGQPIVSAMIGGLGSGVGGSGRHFVTYSADATIQSAGGSIAQSRPARAPGMIEHSNSAKTPSIGLPAGVAVSSPC